jgi:hypothetical protein
MNLLQKGDLPRSACVLGVATNESKVQHGTGTVYHWYAHEALARYTALPHIVCCALHLLCYSWRMQTFNMRDTRLANAWHF